MPPAIPSFALTSQVCRILLKNFCLIEAQVAESIPILSGGLCYDESRAGSLGGADLSVLAASPCSSRSLAALDGSASRSERQARVFGKLSSHKGHTWIDPRLLIRMLLVGYCCGLRSERRLCEKMHLNLAYRWFCRLELSDRIPDHSIFFKNRHGRFRERDLLRHVFEMTIARCIGGGPG